MEDRVDNLEREVIGLRRRFEEAFPSGDHVGHRRYHELIIEQTEETRRLRRAVIEKSIAGIVWGALLGLAVAVWEYVKREIRG